MSSMEHATSTTPANEIWRPVKGYEGYYEVSDHARVRSVDRVVKIVARGTEYERRTRGQIIMPIKTKNGYLRVGLKRNNICFNASVHRLVAEAFIPNPDNLPEVNHKDECKTNNLPSNLEWCDHRYNQTYGTKIERRNAKVSKPIEQLTLDGRHVSFYESAPDAVRKSNGKFRQSVIFNAIIGKIKTAYGYQWRYI